jgi:tetratricopeptide (TPR) repeat protein
LLYDKKQKTEAVQLWEKSTQIDPTYSIPWRNLGLAAYNVEKDAGQAQVYYQRAFEVNPKDPRVLSELDQIRSRLRISFEDRLAELNKNLDVVNLRDDLIVQRVALLLRTGQAEAALDVLKNHHFHPWEGGEGQVSGCWNAANLQLGREAYKQGDFTKALEFFKSSIQFPNNLGEVSFGEFKPGSSYHIGLAREALGDMMGAKEAYREILQDHISSRWGSNLYYLGQAQAKLGQTDESIQTFKHLLEMGTQEIEQPFELNYFYPQNPSVTFLDNPEKNKQLRGYAMVGLARTGLNQLEAAREAFETILDQDPANLEAWSMLQQIQ